VFLSQKDVTELASGCKLTYTEFVKKYCRWVLSADGTERLSLKEKTNLDCIFWDDGCRVYKSRPLQCRTFPFWPSVLKRKETWELTGKDCPGINHGKLHDLAEIEKILESQEAHPILTRDTLLREDA